MVWRGRGWNQPLELRFDPQSHELRIRSAGADRRFDSEVYLVGPFEPLDYDRDIVYVDGEFVRWPESVKRR